MDRRRAVLAVHILPMTLATGALLGILILIRRPGVALLANSELSSKGCMMRAGRMTVGADIRRADRLVAERAIPADAGQRRGVVGLRNARLAVAGMTLLAVGAVQGDGIVAIEAVAGGILRLFVVSDGLRVLAVAGRADNPLGLGADMAGRAESALASLGVQVVPFSEGLRTIGPRMTAAAGVLGDGGPLVAGRAVLQHARFGHTMVHRDRAVQCSLLLRMAVFAIAECCCINSTMALDTGVGVGSRQPAEMMAVDIGGGIDRRVTGGAIDPGIGTDMAGCAIAQSIIRRSICGAMVHRHAAVQHRLRRMTTFTRQVAGIHR